MTRAISYFFIFWSISSYVSANYVFAEVNPRIISLAPVVTEIILELGQERLIVGKTNFCKTSNKTRIKELGTYLNLSIESIVSLSPTHVIHLPEQKELAIKLNKLKINTLEVSNRSLKEIDNAILSISNILSVKEVAESLIKEKHAKLTEVLNTCAHLNEKNKKGIFIFDDGSLGVRKLFYVAPKNSFYSEVMNLVNVTNIIEIKNNYSEISLEGIKSLSLEKIYLVSESGNPKDVVNNLVKFSGLSIEQIILLPQEPILFPGPRYPEIVKLFACNL